MRKLSRPINLFGQKDHAESNTPPITDGPLARQRSGMVALRWPARFVYPEKEDFALIEKNLYMGGLVKAPPPGTKAVLNLCEQQDSYACDVQFWKPIHDGQPVPSGDWLRDAVDIIDQQQKLERVTYVHCFAGASPAAWLSSLISCVKTIGDAIRPWSSFARNDRKHAPTHSSWSCCSNGIARYSHNRQTQKSIFFRLQAQTVVIG